jgi:hypothetical protein
VNIGRIGSSAGTTTGGGQDLRAVFHGDAEVGGRRDRAGAQARRDDLVQRRPGAVEGTAEDPSGDAHLERVDAGQCEDDDAMHGQIFAHLGVQATGSGCPSARS